MNRSIVFTTFTNVDNLRELFIAQEECYSEILCDMPTEEAMKLFDQSAEEFVVISASDNNSLLAYAVFNEVHDILWIELCSFTGPSLFYQLVRFALGFCSNDHLAIGVNSELFSSTVSEVLREIGYGIVSDIDDAADLFPQQNSVDDDYAVVNPGLTPSFKVECVFGRYGTSIKRNSVLYSRKALFTRQDDRTSSNKSSRYSSMSIAKPGYRAKLGSGASSGNGPRHPRNRRQRYQDTEVSGSIAAVYSSFFLVLSGLSLWAILRKN
ncbi:hypothetical protein MP638_005791 [Amoeboaphelidium occidentale]|nr:hypothetical protein MP638_005791 [Amoeboaphelidium occidentale]